MGQNPDPVNHPCISTMLEGTSFGNRHAVALRMMIAELANFKFKLNDNHIPIDSYEPPEVHGELA